MALGAVLWGLLGCSEPASAPVREPVPTRFVIVIVIDTLRADVLAEAQTPVLDALAQGGASVEHAWAPSSWTGPSVASLFTGAPVRSHGWNLPFPSELEAQSQTYPPLPDTLPTLAEVLAEAGVVGHGLVSNPLLVRELGMERGFESWLFVRDEAMPRWVRKTVRSWQPGTDRFLYVHLSGPHTPLRPGAATRQRWGLDDERYHLSDLADTPAARDAYRRAYTGVVEETDWLVGQILGALGPLRHDALVVVTSDHGEMLGEHGELGHTRGVWEPLAWVPLITSKPLDPPLPPTMSVAAVPDLVTTHLGIAHDWPVRVHGEAPLVIQRGDALALTADGRRKGSWDAQAFPERPDHFAAFDLVTDPAESRPLDGVSIELSAARAAWEALVPAQELVPEEAPMSPGLRESLQALGYLE